MGRLHSVELIGGEIYDADAGAFLSTEVLTELVLIFGNFLKGKSADCFQPLRCCLPDKGAADRTLRQSFNRTYP